VRTGWVAREAVGRSVAAQSVWFSGMLVPGVRRLVVERVGGRVGPRCSAERRGGPQLGERGEQRRSPWPVGLQPQPGPPA
jgi:hypothetical protein